ncbi:hypothetical protein PHPALM_28977 [Phytophthora palmivora]|uniref:Uncharacterized protein n=1 Tax=Phytophthora palmivora TaxID=4796 RepID=A0A2P4X8Q7_9STRA|nr:hypothetical protein PHPALM_28977 [Phytophthora palmivora]
MPRKWNGSVSVGTVNHVFVVHDAQHERQLLLRRTSYCMHCILDFTTGDAGHQHAWRGQWCYCRPMR